MKRGLLFISSVLIIITMLPSYVLSESRVSQNQIITDVISADEVDFLKNYKISPKEIAMLKRDEAQRVISQAKIYNLSEIQVKSLVNIELYGNRLDVTKDKEAIGNRLDAKTVIPDRYAGIKHQLTEADVKNNYHSNLPMMSSIFMMRIPIQTIKPGYIG